MSLTTLIPHRQVRAYRVRLRTDEGQTLYVTYPATSESSAFERARQDHPTTALSVVGNRPLEYVMAEEPAP